MGGYHKRSADAEPSYGYGYQAYGYGYHKRSADAEPSYGYGYQPYGYSYGYGYEPVHAPALAYHPYGGVSYTDKSPQGLHKREAEAEPSYGYKSYGYGYQPYGYGYKPSYGYSYGYHKREAEPSYGYGYQPYGYSYGYGYKPS